MNHLESEMHFPLSNWYEQPRFFTNIWCQEISRSEVGTEGFQNRFGPIKIPHIQWWLTAALIKLAEAAGMHNASNYFLSVPEVGNVPALRVRAHFRTYLRK
jgi:hypothetical protein